nr:amidohydrolase family protein [Dehalobacterium formicoaceticum]
MDRIVQGLALKDDKILAVGDNKEIIALSGLETIIVDLAGKTMIPGFYDAHGHFSFASEQLLKVNLSSPPVGEKVSIDDYIAALKEKAAQTPSGDWIYGTGYDDTLIHEMRHLTRDDFDKVSTEHPIWISHVSFHMGVGNSRALAIKGITKDTPNPEGGVIVRDSVTGVPTGLMEETAMNLVQGSFNMDLSQDQRMAAFNRAAQVYAQAGVTTASDGLVQSLKLIESYQQGVRDRHLKIRVALNPAFETIVGGKTVYPDNIN